MPKQDMIDKAEDELLSVLTDMQDMYSYLFTLNDNYLTYFEELRGLIKERREKLNQDFDMETHLGKMASMLRYLHDNCDEKCVLLNKIENMEKKIKTIEMDNLLLKQTPSPSPSPSPSPVKARQRPDIPKYCHCEKKSYGAMIQCDNDLCPMEWFHFKCVNVTTKPKGKWYCLNCRAGTPNKMKPKGEILRQLAEYNQMKEGEFVMKADVP